MEVIRLVLKYCIIYNKAIEEELLMKVFDEFLQEDVEVQEEITPEIGKEMLIKDPEEFNFVLEGEDQ